MPYSLVIDIIFCHNSIHAAVYFFTDSSAIVPSSSGENIQMYMTSYTLDTMECGCISALHVFISTCTHDYILFPLYIECSVNIYGGRSIAEYCECASSFSVSLCA